MIIVRGGFEDIDREENTICKTIKQQRFFQRHRIGLEGENETKEQYN
jgi:hypothetical protein